MGVDLLEDFDVVCELRNGCDVTLSVREMPALV